MDGWTGYLTVDQPHSWKDRVDTLWTRSQMDRQTGYFMDQPMGGWTDQVLFGLVHGWTDWLLKG